MKLKNVMANFSQWLKTGDTTICHLHSVWYISGTSIPILCVHGKRVSRGTHSVDKIHGILLGEIKIRIGTGEMTNIEFLLHKYEIKSPNPSIINLRVGAKEMAQWLRAHVTFAEDPGSVPNTYDGGSQLFITPVSEDSLFWTPQIPALTCTPLT